MIETTRRRFLTILGVGAAGTILPAGYTGETGAIIQAVEDPVTRSINMARGIAEYAMASNMRNPSRLVHGETHEFQVLHRKWEDLFAYMDENFPNQPRQAEVTAMFDGTGPRLADLSSGEAKALSAEVTPIAIFINMFRVQQVTFDVRHTPSFLAFMTRYKSLVLA